MKIIDIRGSTTVSNTEDDMKKAIINSISRVSVPFIDSREIRKGGKVNQTLLRSLPTMILYDDKGLEIFDKITYDKDYYLTNAEIEVLQNNSNELVAKYVKDGDVLIELGAGAMRKTKYILDAITKANRKVTYYAVDLAEASLRQSLEPLATAYPSIAFVGLWGTYHDSLSWIQKSQADARKLFLWLGSSIGNLTRKEGADFLLNVRNTAMKDGDLFLCGIDKRNSFETVSLAYNDRSGLTRDFALNGLVNINNIFKHTVFDPSAFMYVSIYNEVEGRHEAYYESAKDQTIEFKEEKVSVHLKKGELINFEYSYKYSAEEVSELVQEAKMSYLGKWTESKNLYSVHMFYRSPIYFDSKIGLGEQKMPTIEEWKELWKASDTITRKIIDPSRYLNKPISLRHPYIFYLGHLPAFLDIQLSRAVGIEPTNKYFAEIFERGIDPIMEDPSICHSHSKVPTVWPKVQEILDFTSSVRNRLQVLLNDGNLCKKQIRAINMSFEHEALHIETLLYMFMQDKPISDLSLFPVPIFDSFKEKYPEASWIKVDGGKFKMGLNDLESKDNDPNIPPTMFGWDCEVPEIETSLEPFEIQHRPVTVMEYYDFLVKQEFREELIPSSWIKEESNYTVRSVYGSVPLKHAGLWPVATSQSQAMAYAKYHNCTLPTEEQLAYIRRTSNSAVDYTHSFKTLHPQPVKLKSNQVENIVGNGWELTNTVFYPFEGFEQNMNGMRGKKRFSILGLGVSGLLADAKKSNHIQFSTFLSDTIRLDYISTVRKTMIDGLLACAHVSCDSEDYHPNSPQTHDMKQRVEFIQLVALEVENWLIERNKNLANYLKSNFKIKCNLVTDMENFHWVILNQINEYDVEVNSQLWDRYAVKYEGQSGDYMDADYEVAKKLKVKAIKFFTEKFLETLKLSTAKELTKALYAVTKFSTGPDLLDYLLPDLMKTEEKELTSEIIPKFLLYCATSKDKFVISTMESFLTRTNHLITTQIINSVLEFSSHNLDSDCGCTILSSQREKITKEGLICAFMVSSIKGNEQLVALLQLQASDFLTDINPNVSIGTQPYSDEISFQTFFPPFIYVFMALAAATTHSRQTVIGELITYYEQNNFEIDLTDIGIHENIHKMFMANLFNISCRLNHSNVVIALIEKECFPDNLVPSIYESVEHGHQKILHLILETLLFPDKAIDTASGAVPILFRKSQVLKYLPFIANRFPQEVSWFFDEISNIPIPSCVPVAEDRDPFVRSRLVKGVKLGATTLKTVVKPPEHASPNEIWNNLNFEGQLRNASSKKTDNSYESESIICMIPQILVTEPAFRETWLNDGTRQTNSLVRLLSTGDETVKTNNPNEYSNAPIYALSALTLFLSFIFVVQEGRQFVDDMDSYIHSTTNVIDLSIHMFVLYTIISDVFLGVNVEPLIMALVIVFASMRLLLYLRIFPSVGPVVRITSSALLNVIPILIPMSILIAAYTSALLNDQEQVFSIFFCRIMFHATFLICFINLIVALMTVNVADVTSNMRAAWLVEISELMVELELYWPWPFNYPKWIREDLAALKSSNFNINDDGTVQGEAASFNSKEKSEIDNEIENIVVVLYTAPRDIVIKKSWWNDYPKTLQTSPIGLESLKMSHNVDLEYKGTVQAKPEPIFSHVAEFPKVEEERSEREDDYLLAVFPPARKNSFKTSEPIPRKNSFNGIESSGNHAPSIANIQKSSFKKSNEFAQSHIIKEEGQDSANSITNLLRKNVDFQEESQSPKPKYFASALALDSPSLMRNPTRGKKDIASRKDSVYRDRMLSVSAVPSTQEVKFDGLKAKGKIHSLAFETANNDSFYNNESASQIQIPTNMQQIETLIRFEMKKSREAVTRLENMIQKTLHHSNNNTSSVSADADPNLKVLIGQVEKLTRQVQKLSAEKANNSRSFISRLFGSPPVYHSTSRLGSIGYENLGSTTSSKKAQKTYPMAGDDITD
ncbi:hypothetical protein HDV06_003761 [Boothiomyces sp. JEL0866]|nr:hypothetical protein HDV06_003761 [Boothiomyces sp. JEL0866]